MSEFKELEIGMKLIIVEASRYSRGDGEVYHITTDVVTRKNIKTFSTEKKQTLECDNGCFRFYHSIYDRKRLTCDVTVGKTFTPNRIEIFNDDDYNFYTAKIQARMDEENDIKVKYEKRLEARKEFDELEKKLNNELWEKIQLLFVKKVCYKCKNYNADKDICKVKRHCDYGKLKNTEYSITDCSYWEGK